MPYSAALAAGLKPGDRLLEVDGRKITAPAEFSETIAKLKGTPFRLTYERDGKTSEVTLAARLILSDGVHTGDEIYIDLTDGKLTASARKSAENGAK